MLHVDFHPTDSGSSDNDTQHAKPTTPAGSSSSSSTTTKKSGRGFAGMDPQRQREISSMGGKASHEQGTGHEFTSAEAAAAGRKGGQASHGSKKRAASNSGSGNPVNH